MFSITSKLLITIVSFGLTNIILSTKLELRSGNCNFKPDVYSNFTLKFANSKANVDMILVSILPYGLKAHLSFGIRTSKEKAYQIIYQHNINNYCSLIKGSQDSLYSRWFLDMQKHGNFATSCPIQRGYYYLHNWGLDTSLVPSFLYIGDYQLILRMYYGKYQKNDYVQTIECIVQALLV